MIIYIARERERERERDLGNWKAGQLVGKPWIHDDIKLYSHTELRRDIKLCTRCSSRWYTHSAPSVTAQIKRGTNFQLNRYWMSLCIPPQKKILQRNYFKKTTNSCGIKPEPPRTKYSLNCKTTRADIFNLQAPCVLYIGQAFRYSPENDFYVFNQQIYFIIWYLLDRATLI